MTAVLAGDPRRVTFREIPSGERGTIETLKTMGRLALQDSHHPEVIALARSAVRGLPSKDYVAEADRLFGLVKRSVRYVMDPGDLERVARPWVTLCVEGQGDCDDHSAALGALATALNHGFAFTTVAADGRRPNARSWSHVYPLIGVRRGGDTVWLAADTTQANSFLGWEPPDEMVTARKTWIVRHP